MTRRIVPLIKHHQLIDDTFVGVADDAPMPINGAIVCLNRLRAERDTLLARNSPLGVLLKSSESPETLGQDVHRLALVALEFPAFRDGRPFSWARMLRTRMCYAGEIRAVGHFLYDQIAFLMRVGIDAFEVSPGFTLERFNRALGEMSHVYQPSSDRRMPIPELRHTAQARETEVT
jgi:uncharacterized protein (DUF934 family)